MPTVSPASNFLIITHVKHTCQNGQYHAYGPYVREMNLWLRHTDKATVLAPLDRRQSPGPIDLPYQHGQLHFVPIPAFHFKTLAASLHAILVIPYICIRMLILMRRASHIHLRCPGNMGLLGAMLQVFFPHKKKTAKYAGNWDPDMPVGNTYEWQRKLIANPRLTRNMQVLVYGDWPGQSANVLPFFTASYTQAELLATPPRSLQGTIYGVFCGSLTPEKAPLRSVEVVHALRREGIDIRLRLLGEGQQRSDIEAYIARNDLQNCILLEGNVSAEVVKKHLQQSHFLLFFSESEGWPKAVAEAMFWGCVPVVREVSFTRFMLGNGSRGIAVQNDVESMKKALMWYLEQAEVYRQTSLSGMEWARQFTLERFEGEVKKLMQA